MEKVFFYRVLLPIAGLSIVGIIYSFLFVDPGGIRRLLVMVLALAIVLLVTFFLLQRSVVRTRKFVANLGLTYVIFGGLGVLLGAHLTDQDIYLIFLPIAVSYVGGFLITASFSLK